MRKLMLMAALLWAGHAWAARPPAILFAVPGENRYAYVGFDYMREVAKAGFAVDYVEGADAVTWERLTNFNVVVVLDFPAATPEAHFSYFSPRDIGKRAAYCAALDRFRAAGGGVLLHYSPGHGGGAPNEWLASWGLKFPVIALRDSNTRGLSNMTREHDCAFTDRIAPSPVSEGVRQLWYPIFGRHYYTWHTMPILTDAGWLPVVRASASAWTEVPAYNANEAPPPATALIPDAPIADPVLFAIREDPGGAGRLAAVQTWHCFSIGSGMKWLYNNEVLERGLAARPSHYGRLLLNTYRWLAEPSLASGALGGYPGDAARLLEPQLQPGAQDRFHEWDYEETDVLEYRRPPSQGRLFRGLIGAQTAASGGAGTVAEYAAAAAAAGLDFLVFLEDFDRLSEADFRRLTDDTRAQSTPALLLLAGYRLRSNIGNRVFVFGHTPPWPDPLVLCGADAKTFNLQHQDGEGQWVRSSASLNWVLTTIHSGPGKSTLGYYDFGRSGGGAMRMFDLRCFSHAALRTYEEGRLIEDMTDDYLTTCQGTAVPTPVTVNLVRSPAELTAAVAAGQSLTYAQAHSLERLWDQAMRWNNSYDGLNVFTSDGPKIEAWPKNLRVMTFGAERFVSGRSLQIAPIHVTADAGLKEIRLYDGQALFRRFACDGATNFTQQLLFPGVIQRSLVLVAEDVKGGKAVSFALRQYKEGSKCPIFCSDHVNDCGGMLLARGPHWSGMVFNPAVPDAGQTWDGGPTAVRPFLTGQWTEPFLHSEADEWKGESPYQVPMLEFSDEGATRCRMVCNRKLRADVRRLSLNPWNGYGPLEPTTFADGWSSHTYFGQYSLGVDPQAYGAPAILEGPVASLFTEQLTFKSNGVVRALQVFHGGWRGNHVPDGVQLAVGRGARILDSIDLSVPPVARREVALATGDWFAFYSSHPANTQLYINRGPALVLRLSPAGDYWLRAFLAEPPGDVATGDTFDTEIFAMSWPMSMAFRSAGELAQVVGYLAEPAGLELTRGTRAGGAGGLLELTPADGAVELALPKSSVPLTVPVRAGTFNKRWSLGLYQVDGYRTHYYSKENSGYRALGSDLDGRVYVPLYAHMAERTHVRFGHPIVADDAGRELFIQVTRISDGGATNAPAWHVSVNNPTDAAVTAALRQTLDVPGLSFAARSVTLKPGAFQRLE